MLWLNFIIARKTVTNFDWSIDVSVAWTKNVDDNQTDALFHMCCASSVVFFLSLLCNCTDVFSTQRVRIQLVAVFQPQQTQTNTVKTEKKVVWMRHSLL